jgi:hypothetical protein
MNLNTEMISDGSYTMGKDRVKVFIRCKHCGESYILRGTVDRGGHVITGFKRCLCDNETDFETEPLV